MKFETYIMAFGPHPDDVDVWCGGTLYKTALQWKQNIIIDLTPSQMSTKWNPTLRQQEAWLAAEVLGVKRQNLLLDDLTICDDDSYRKIIAQTIRQYKPEIIMIPNFIDRHPDHEWAAQLVKNAIFVSWLSKYIIDDLEAFRPRLVLEYMLWDNFKPDLIVWLSQSQYDKKLEALNCFQSQIDTNKRADNYMQWRSLTLWWEVWSDHGEWFRLYQSHIWVDNFDHIHTRAF